MNNKSSYLVPIAVLVVLLLGASVVRQYNWLTDLSGLQEEQAVRTLARTTNEFVRQLGREVESLWYPLHIRAGRDPAVEIADDYRSWVEGTESPDLLVEAFWVVGQPGRGAPTEFQGESFSIQRISLDDQEFGPRLARADHVDLTSVLQLAHQRAQGRSRRSSAINESFLMTMGGDRPDQYAFVVPQPELGRWTWVVALLSGEVLETSLVGTLVDRHYGAGEDRQFNVRVSTTGETPAVIFASGVDETVLNWADPDIERDSRYFAVAVKHEEGSIAIAASNVRRANLFFTFGVVTVLLATLGVLGRGGAAYFCDPRRSVPIRVRQSRCRGAGRSGRADARGR